MADDVVRSQSRLDTAQVVAAQAGRHLGGIGGPGAEPSLRAQEVRQVRELLKQVRDIVTLMGRDVAEFSL